MIDVVLLLAVIVLPVLSILNVEGPARRLAGVLALTLSPGWGVLRCLGAPAGALTFIAALSLSIALLMLTGLLLVTRLEWAWEGGLMAIEALSATTLAYAMVRWRQQRR